MFYDTYAELCRRSVEKPYAVAALCGATSNSSVAQWQKGSTPRKAVLQKIAEHFGVTIDYLLTGEEKQPSVPEGLPEKDQRLIAWFRSLKRKRKRLSNRTIIRNNHVYQNAGRPRAAKLRPPRSRVDPIISCRRCQLKIDL